MKIQNLIMNYYFFSILAIFSLTIKLNAQITTDQDQTATFENGTKIKYHIIDNSGDNIFQNTIALTVDENDKYAGFDVLYQRYEPQFFLAQGEIGVSPAGFAGIAVGGTYFLLGSTKNYLLPIAIRTEVDGQTQTKYVIKTPAVKNRHIGVNAELAYNNFSASLYQVNVDYRNYMLTSLSAPQIAIGLGYVTTKQALINVDTKSYMGGSRLFHMSLDVLVSPVAKFTYTTNDSASAAVPLTTKDISHGTVGFRFLIQGQNSFKFNKTSIPKLKMGFFYRAGVTKSAFSIPSLGEFNGFCGILELGVFGNF